MIRSTYPRLLAVAIAILALVGCDEIGPQINPTGGSGSGSVQARNILVEEFTGVRCVNCPAGSAELQSLIDIHEGQVIGVSIHSGFFANPYPQSTIDFRTEDADQIFDLLGGVSAYPAAIINRQLFNGENELALPLTKWAGYIAEELQEPSAVNLTVTPNYVVDSRQLTVDIDGVFNEAVPDDVNITAYLVENNVVNAQYTPQTSNSAPDENYVHKHVFRDAITNFSGDPITEPKVVGGTFSKDITYTLPGDYVAENCTVVVFVHQSLDSKRVLQAVEVDVL